jgi:hypothetical protein
MLDEPRRDPLRGYRASLWVLAAVAAATAVAWWLGRTALLDHWRGFYGNWRDLYLTVRVARAPGFFATLAGLAVATALALRWTARFDHRRPEAGGRPLFLWALLAVTLLVGLPLSLAEWQRYGLPCWDGYCERSALWAGWFRHPSVAALGDVFSATAEFHTGASLLPPVLIGAVAALGPSIVSAFMLVNLASWLAVALLTASLGRRYLGYGPTEVAVTLVLLFAHLATVRSLLFLQTDPLGLAFLLLALHANLAYARRPAPATAGALLATKTVGLASKLSFAPMLAVPPLASLVVGRELSAAQPPDGRRAPDWPRRGRDALVRGLAFSLAPAALFVTFLSATGLLRALLFELGYVAGHQTASANFYADNNPLRFLVASLVTFQVFPLLLARHRRHLVRDPARRLLVAVGVLFIASLVAMRTAFWPRYFLPLVPLLALLAAKPLVEDTPGRASRVLLLTAYLAANAAFLAFGLYY